MRLQRSTSTLPTQVLSSLNTFLKLWNGGFHLFANGECKQGGGRSDRSIDAVAKVLVPCFNVRYSRKKGGVVFHRRSLGGWMHSRMKVQRAISLMVQP